MGLCGETDTVAGIAATESAGEHLSFPRPGGEERGGTLDPKGQEQGKLLTGVDRVMQGVPTVERGRPQINLLPPDGPSSKD